MGKKSNLPFGKNGPSKKRGRSGLGLVGGLAVLGGLVYIGSTFYLSRTNSPSDNLPKQPTKRERPPKRERSRSPPDAAPSSGSGKYGGFDWQTLPRDLDGCITSQEELMTVPVEWPGFHALCIANVNDKASVSVLLHPNSGKRAKSAGPRTMVAMDEGVVSSDNTPLLDALLSKLSAELLEHEFKQVDTMISTSAYDFPPNPWRLYTQRGHLIDSDEDFASLGRGAALWLYTGGQFIWPGVRLGHQMEVPIPLPGGDHKMVTLTTRSLRPTVLELSGFLSDDECAYIKKYASSRMVPSGVATMDSSGDTRDVRTSTQTFLERNGSPQIRALEERAHNLTRLPYDLGENIQVVRYEVGQKYGAHRDFFNPNDYHRQPHMLRSVEYGARNRLATVFWYLESVAEGGETYFPRALNEEGKEYKPWNGDHEDCYRGLAVPPIRGNAVLFYSMVPDGRLDERSLHGGCKPRGSHIEKWGANQWIWNHPQRRSHSGVAPRKGAKRPTAPVGAKPGCVDSDENCAAWAESGECAKNPAYMESACRASCGAC